MDHGPLTPWTLDLGPWTIDTLDPGPPVPWTLDPFLGPETRSLDLEPETFSIILGNFSIILEIFHNFGIFSIILGYFHNSRIFSIILRHFPYIGRFGSIGSHALLVAT